MSFPGIPSLDAAVMAFIQTHFHNTVTDTVFPIITSLRQSLTMCGPRGTNRTWGAR